MFIAQPILGAAQINNNNQINSPELSIQKLPDNNPVPTIEIKGAGGEQELKTNIVRDESFTEVAPDGGPYYFYYGGDGYRYVNSSYQDDTYAGSYSMMVSAQGTDQFSESATGYRYFVSETPRAYIDQNLTLEFAFKTNSNPDSLYGSQTYSQISMYNGSWFYLYYYFSKNDPLPANSTNQKYIDTRESIGSWFFLQRNLTYDFLSSFGAISPSVYLYTINFITLSIIAPSGPTELIIDNVKVYDGTLYQYGANNWDFELGNSAVWGNSKRGPSAAKITTNDSTEGDSCLNLSAQAYYQQGYSSVYCEQACYQQWNNIPVAFYSVNPGDLVVDFNWKYSDVANGGNDQEARFYVVTKDATTYYYLIFYLGNGEDLMTQTNSTGTNTYYYFLADDYGVRNTWNHFNLDLYDIFQPIGILGSALIYYGFNVYAGYNANATTELLIDEFQIKTYPAGDPSFEFDYDRSSSKEIPSWITNRNEDYINLTTDAHSGNYAANLTAHANIGTVLAYRDMYLPVEEGLYTDFWWKLDQMSSFASANSIIYLQLNYSYTLYYVLGSSSAYYPSNQSLHHYYFVDDYNTTGVWNNLVRDLYQDIKTGFMEANWFINKITISSFDNTDVVSTLFDDMHFIQDSTGPEVQSIDLLDEPYYYQDVIIDLTVKDALIIVDYVQLYYQNDTTWYYVDAINIGGDVYRATIPKSDYGTVYHYYILSADIYGNTAIDDNSGMYYTFSIGDDIEPIISIIDPLNDTIVSDTIIISVTAEDLGSGINYVEFYDGALFLGIDYSEDYQFELNTREYTNGYHEIICVAYDNMGYDNSESIFLFYDNDLAAPTLNYVVRTPLLPIYNEAVTIEANVTDDSTIAQIQLHYKFGDATWVDVDMTLLGSSVYSATIPTAPWDTLVSYYITATDEYDQTSTFHSAESPYWYVVGDTINPSLAISGLENDDVVKGILELAVTASDDGSGLKSFEVYIDDILIYNTTEIPEIFTFNTREYNDGEHTIQFLLKDNANNAESYSFNFIIDNPPLAIIISLTSLGTLTAVAIGVTIFIFIQKKRVA